VRFYERHTTRLDLGLLISDDSKIIKIHSQTLFFVGRDKTVVMHNKFEKIRLEPNVTLFNALSRMFRGVDEEYKVILRS
jgi:hypothetical protein